MRFKGTLALLIVCLALGAYLYFYEIKGEQQREQAKEEENRLWKVESNDVRQMDFISPDQQITAVRKSEKEWVITAPRSLNADSDELNRLANSAANIQRETIVEQNAVDLAKFGLDPARATLRLRTENGKELGILFGNSNPTGSSAYAILPEQKDVFLVPSSLVSTFDKKLDDLRMHSVLSFEQREVQSLSLKSAKGNLDLVKDSDDRWWIVGEEKVAADSPGVRGILTSLSLARIEEFFDENPDDYENLGLNMPLVDVSLVYGKNKAQKRLLIGTEKPLLREKGQKKMMEQDYNETSASEFFLAKDDSRQDLFFVEKDLVDKILKSREDLRDKALAAFQRWDIDVIILRNSKGMFTFFKSGGEWFLGDGKKKAKWETVNGLLDVMEKSVKEFLDKPTGLSNYGLEKPSIRIVLKEGSNAIVDCSLGKGATGAVYAQVKGDSSVKLLDPESYDTLDKDESDFAEVPAAGDAEANGPKS